MRSVELFASSCLACLLTMSLTAHENSSLQILAKLCSC
jgi:hypothetical protein